MDRRYVDELNFRFDQVEETGFAVLTDREITRWWERQRITRSVWQDLQDRWSERFEVPLKVGQRSGKTVLIWGDDWLAPIEDWSGAAS